MPESYTTTLTIKSNGDGQPKPWSQIRYTVIVNMPLSMGSTAAVEYANVQSARFRPDNPLDVQPAAVGSSHECAVVLGNYLRAYIDEDYAMAPCPGSAAASSLTLPGGTVNQDDQDGPGGGTGTQGTGSETGSGTGTTDPSGGSGVPR